MEWVRGATIGQGSFSTVSLAIIKNTDTHQLLGAVKSCQITQFDSLMNEKRILEEFQDCPDVIRCYGDSYTYENGEKMYNILLEYASQGTLFDKIKNSSDRRLQEDTVRQYTKGIVRGLYYIHKNGFVHCDIKLQNILLNQDGHIKIADFGLAKKIGEKRDGDSMCELRGTPMYMSPEMVVRGEQGSAADVWALGCLISEMLTGTTVWNCSDIAALFVKISGGAAELPEIQAKISHQGKDFISKCLCQDPITRWTAKMLLNHPFLTSDDDHNDQPSISPRSPFDFPVSDQSSLTLPVGFLLSPELIGTNNSSFPGKLNSPADRLRRLVSSQQQCHSSSSLEWFNVR